MTQENSDRPKFSKEGEIGEKKIIKIGDNRVHWPWNSLSSEAKGQNCKFLGLNISLKKYNSLNHLRENFEERELEKRQEKKSPFS